MTSIHTTATVKGAAFCILHGAKILKNAKPTRRRTEE
jgi:hypothetical protein